jgi:hypothetical protein
MPDSIHMEGPSGNPLGPSGIVPPWVLYSRWLEESIAKLWRAIMWLSVSLLALAVSLILHLIGHLST